MNKFLEKFRNRKYFRTYRKKGWHNFKEVIGYFLANNYEAFLWSYTLALRGPDDPNTPEDTKRVYQGLIRGLYSPGLDTPVFLDVIGHYLEDNISPEQLKEKAYLLIHNEHYRNHTSDGVGALEAYYEEIDPKISKLLGLLREGLIKSDMTVLEDTIIKLFRIVDGNIESKE